MEEIPAEVKSVEEIAEVRKLVIVRLDRRIVMAMCMCFLSCFALCAMTFAFAVHVARQEGQNFCELLGTYDQVYRDNPPQTETGRTLALEVSRLVNRLGCQDS